VAKKISWTEANGKMAFRQMAVRAVLGREYRNHKHVTRISLICGKNVECVLTNSFTRLFGTQKIVHFFLKVVQFRALNIYKYEAEVPCGFHGSHFTFSLS